MNANDNQIAETASEPMPSRRTVLGAGGAVGLALLNPGSIFAQGADGANTIRVGFISPRTGALAGFGEADGYVLELARKSLKDGLTVEARSTRSRSSIATRNPIRPEPASWQSH